MRAGDSTWSKVRPDGTLKVKKGSLRSDRRAQRARHRQRPRLGGHLNSIRSMRQQQRLHHPAATSTRSSPSRPVQPINRSALSKTIAKSRRQRP